MKYGQGKKHVTEENNLEHKHKWSQIASSGLLCCASISWEYVTGTAAFSNDSCRTEKERNELALCWEQSGTGPSRRMVVRAFLLFSIEIVTVAGKKHLQIKLTFLFRAL